MNDHELEVGLRSIHRDFPGGERGSELQEWVHGLRFDDIPQRRGILHQLALGGPGSMFGATKFVVAGAIVALFGGFLVIAQPFDRQDGNDPGAAIESPSPVGSPTSTDLRERCDGTLTGSEETECMLTLVDPPVAIRGSIHAFPCTGGSGGAILGVLHEACDHETEAEWSDPRLEGTLTITEDRDRYLSEDGSGRPSGLVLWSLAVRIESQDGAWQMRPFEAIDVPDETGAATLILEGEGAYEDLVALLRVDGPLLGASDYSPTGYIVARDDLGAMSGDPNEQ